MFNVCIFVCFNQIYLMPTYHFLYAPDNDLSVICLLLVTNDKNQKKKSKCMYKKMNK